MCELVMNMAREPAVVAECCDAAIVECFVWCEDSGSSSTEHGSH